MKKIIFIEDEPALQKTLGEVLKQEGYEVTSASDGEMGLKSIRQKQPDLILLDLILPKINGFEVLKQIKEDVKTKDIPVIVLTNLERVEDVEKVVKYGATTYLVKSQYSMEELIQKIKKIIG